MPVRQSTHLISRFSWLPQSAGRNAKRRGFFDFRTVSARWWFLHKRLGVLLQLEFLKPSRHRIAEVSVLVYRSSVAAAQCLREMNGFLRQASQVQSLWHVGVQMSHNPQPLPRPGSNCVEVAEGLGSPHTHGILRTRSIESFALTHLK